MFIVKDSEPHHRESSEEHIEELEDPLIIVGLTREGRREAKPDYEPMLTRTEEERPLYSCKNCNTLTEHFDGSIHVHGRRVDASSI